MTFQVRNLEDVKDGEIIKSGHGIRVRLRLMDSAAADPAALAVLNSMKDSGPQIIHRPGQLATMTDTHRVLKHAARETHIQRMNDAWRTPVSQERKASPELDTKPDPMAARAARNARVSDAWKGGR